MTLSYNGSFNTSTATGSVFVTGAANIPSTNLIVASTFSALVGTTTFKNFNVSTLLGSGSSYASFPSTSTLKGMDFITTTKLVSAWTLSTSTHIYTINTSSGTVTDLGALYSTANGIRQVVASISSGYAIVIPSIDKLGQVGFVNNATSSISVLTPSWLTDFKIYAAAVADTSGFVLCGGYTNNNDVTFFLTDPTFNLLSTFSIRSSNILPSDIVSMKYSNGYIILITDNSLFLIDSVSGDILQSVTSLGGSKITSSLNSSSLAIAHEPYISEIDFFTTPPTNNGVFNSSYNTLGFMDYNPTAGRFWFIQSGTKTVDVATYSGLRATSNQFVQLTDGSGVDCKVTLINDSTSPASVLFSTTIPAAGRNVPISTGKSIVTIASYGDGIDQKFKATRTAT